MKELPRATALRAALAMALVGCAGMTLQVLAVRTLGEVLGQSGAAVALVLSVFLLGIGAGAALGGRAVDAGVVPSRMFAMLQASLALYAACFLPLARVLEELSLRLVPAEATGAMALLLQAPFGIAFLAPPALAIGASVPALLASIAQSDARSGSRFAWLYALDTLGAAAGAIVATFFWLPAFGVAATLATAAGASLLAALLAPRGVSQRERAPAIDPRPRAGDDAVLAPARALLLVAACAGGFAALALELLWTRGLAADSSGTIYGFATVTASFLLGLAGGAALAGVLVRWRRVDARLAAFALLAAAVAGFASLRALQALLSAEGPRASSLIALERGEMLAALLVMLPGCTLFGALFPMLVQLARRSPARAGRDLGAIYLANTLGAAIAPFAAGFVLLPLLGLEGAILACAALPGAAGVALLASTRRDRALAPAALLALALIAWIMPVEIPRGREERVGTLIERRESLAATVSVLRDASGDLVLALEHGYRLGSAASHFMQRRQSVMPLLLHPDPQRVLVLGLGTGTTAGAAAAFGELELDACELLPDVIAMLPHFDAANLSLARRARENAAVRLLAVDARRFVRATERRYDVVIGDLLLPWLRGEGAMYTREHFERLRAVLAPGGIACQWLPVYQCTPESLATIVATFLSAFPAVEVCWLGFDIENLALGLMGSEAPISWDEAAIFSRMADPERRALLESVALDAPARLASHWLCSRRALESWCAGVPEESRARPRHEFLAAQAVVLPPLERVRRCMPSLLDLAAQEADREPFASWSAATRDRARAGLPMLRARAAVAFTGDLEAATSELERALALAPDWTLAARDLDRIAETALAEGRLEVAQRAGETLSNHGPTAAAGYYHLARVAWARGEPDRARAALRSAADLRPEDPSIRELIKVMGPIR